MPTADVENRRVFLVASDLDSSNKYFAQMLNKHVMNVTVYEAHDGQDALFKFDNDPPNVVILDSKLSKFNSIQVAQKILNHEKLKGISLIIVSELPDTEHFVDQVITGQVQFLTETNNELVLQKCLSRALNRLSLHDGSSYSLKFLAPGEHLFEQGDKVESVFILKFGEMKAVKDDIVLGRINAGEFVGEMAHFTGGKRSATVHALTDCELIVIPEGTLDAVLFSKPVWTKALISCLTKRLQTSNQIITDLKITR